LNADILIFTGTGGRPANAMLEAAKTAKLKDVVIIGWDENDEFFMSSGCEYEREIDWLLRNAINEFWRMRNGD